MGTVHRNWRPLTPRLPGTVVNSITEKSIGCGGHLIHRLIVVASRLLIALRPRNRRPFSFKTSRDGNRPDHQRHNQNNLKAEFTKNKKSTSEFEGLGAWCTFVMWDKSKAMQKLFYALYFNTIFSENLALKVYVSIWEWLICHIIYKSIKYI